MVYTTSEIANIINPIAEKHNLKAVFLFGSYARGVAKETSDNVVYFVRFHPFQKQ